MISHFTAAKQPQIAESSR